MKRTLFRRKMEEVDMCVDSETFREMEPYVDRAPYRMPYGNLF
jgi:hypothetical protein